MGFTFDPLVFSGLITSGGGGGGPAGDVHWKAPVTNSAALPLVANSTGDVRITLDTGNIWEWNGTAWFLPAIPDSEKGIPNGVATLDSVGHVPLSQLPASVVEYKGVWDASTNTPTLTDGIGVSGYFYIVSVGGTVDFGSGPITFFAGDWVLYNGTMWERASNFTGYANATLSNLAATTSINSSLLPSTDNTLSLGSDTESWATGYIQDLLDASDNTSVAIYDRELDDSGSATSLQWESRTLNNTSGAIVVNWATTGTLNILEALNLNSHQIHNVTNPSAAQDAATKNYVDTSITAAPFANKSLSNLTNPTAVNLDLNMGGHDVLNAGAVAIGTPTAVGKLTIDNLIAEAAIPAIHLEITDAPGFGFDFMHDTNNTGDLIITASNGSGPTEALRIERATNQVDVAQALNVGQSIVSGTNVVVGTDLSVGTTLDVTSTSSFHGAISLNSRQIHTVANPTSPQDAATKAYVDLAVLVSSGPAGAVQFSDGAGNFSDDDANFHWDDTNHRLSISTNPPGGKLQVDNLIAEGSTPAISLRITDSPTFGFDIMHDTGNTGDLFIDRVNGSTPVEAFRIARADGSITVQNQIHNVTDPTSPQDAATKNYVDSAGSGANVTLSNLTTPTAVNSDLLFNQVGASTVATMDNGSGSTKTIILASGFATSGASGNVIVNSGGSDSNSGSVNIQSGDTTSNASSGGINVITGVGGTSGSGTITIGTGTAADATGTGNVTILTGDTTGAAGAGTININSGNADSTGDSGNISLLTGNGNNVGLINIFTGNSNGIGNSGAINMQSGSTIDPASSTGAVFIGSGAPSTDATSGVVTLSTANVSGAGNAGNINIDAGQAENGTGGSIVLNVGVPFGTGTRGNINFIGPTVSTGSQTVAISMPTGPITVNSVTDYAFVLNDAIGSTITLPAGVQGMTFLFSTTTNVTSPYLWVPNGTDTVDTPIAAGVGSGGSCTRTQIMFISGVWYAMEISVS